MSERVDTIRADEVVRITDESDLWHQFHATVLRVEDGGGHCLLKLHNRNLNVWYYDYQFERVTAPAPATDGAMGEAGIDYGIDLVGLITDTLFANSAINVESCKQHAEQIKAAIEPMRRLGQHAGCHPTADKRVSKLLHRAVEYMEAARVIVLLDPESNSR